MSNSRRRHHRTPYVTPNDLLSLPMSQIRLPPLEGEALDLFTKKDVVTIQESLQAMLRHVHQIKDSLKKTVNERLGEIVANSQIIRVIRDSFHQIDDLSRQVSDHFHYFQQFLGESHQSPSSSSLSPISNSVSDDPLIALHIILHTFCQLSVALVNMYRSSSWFYYTDTVMFYQRIQILIDIIRHDIQIYQETWNKEQVTLIIHPQQHQQDQKEEQPQHLGEQEQQPGQRHGQLPPRSLSLSMPPSLSSSPSLTTATTTALPIFTAYEPFFNDLLDLVHSYSIIADTNLRLCIQAMFMSVLHPVDICPPSYQSSSTQDAHQYQYDHEQQKISTLTDTNFHGLLDKYRYSAYLLSNTITSIAKTSAASQHLQDAQRDQHSFASRREKSSKGSNTRDNKATSLDGDDDAIDPAIVEWHSTHMWYAQCNPLFSSHSSLPKKQGQQQQQQQKQHLSSNPTLSTGSLTDGLVAPSFFHANPLFSSSLVPLSHQNMIQDDITFHNDNNNNYDNTSNLTTIDTENTTSSIYSSYFLFHLHHTAIRMARDQQQPGHNSNTRIVSHTTPNTPDITTTPPTTSATQATAAASPGLIGSLYSKLTDIAAGGIGLAYGSTSTSNNTITSHHQSTSQDANSPREFDLRVLASPVVLHMTDVYYSLELLLNSDGTQHVHGHGDGDGDRDGTWALLSSLPSLQTQQRRIGNGMGSGVDAMVVSICRDLFDCIKAQSLSLQQQIKVQMSLFHRYPLPGGSHTAATGALASGGNSMDDMEVSLSSHPRLGGIVTPIADHLQTLLQSYMHQIDTALGHSDSKAPSQYTAAHIGSSGSGGTQRGENTTVSSSTATAAPHIAMRSDLPLPLVRSLHTQLETQLEIVDEIIASWDQSAGSTLPSAATSRAVEGITGNNRGDGHPSASRISLTLSTLIACTGVISLSSMTCTTLGQPIPPQSSADEGSDLSIAAFQSTWDVTNTTITLLYLLDQMASGAHGNSSCGGNGNGDCRLTTADHTTMHSVNDGVNDTYSAFFEQLFQHNSHHHHQQQRDDDSHNVISFNLPTIHTFWATTVTNVTQLHLDVILEPILPSRIHSGRGSGTSTTHHSRIIDPLSFSLPSKTHFSSKSSERSIQPMDAATNTDADANYDENTTTTTNDTTNGTFDPSKYPASNHALFLQLLPRVFDIAYNGGRRSMSRSLSSSLPQSSHPLTEGYSNSIAKLLHRTSRSVVVSIFGGVMSDMITPQQQQHIFHSFSVISSSEDSNSTKVTNATTTTIATTTTTTTATTTTASRPLHQHRLDPFNLADLLVFSRLQSIIESSLMVILTQSTNLLRSISSLIVSDTILYTLCPLDSSLEQPSALPHLTPTPTPAPRQSLPSPQQGQSRSHSSTPRAHDTVDIASTMSRAGKEKRSPPLHETIFMQQIPFGFLHPLIHTALSTLKPSRESSRSTPPPQSPDTPHSSVSTLGSSTPAASAVSPSQGDRDAFTAVLGGLGDTILPQIPSTIMSFIISLVYLLTEQIYPVYCLAQDGTPRGNGSMKQPHEYTEKITTIEITTRLSQFYTHIFGICVCFLYSFFLISRRGMHVSQQPLNHGGDADIKSKAESAIPYFTSHFLHKLTALLNATPTHARPSLGGDHQMHAHKHNEKHIAHGQPGATPSHRYIYTPSDSQHSMERIHGLFDNLFLHIPAHLHLHDQDTTTTHPRSSTSIHPHGATSSPGMLLIPIKITMNIQNMMDIAALISHIVFDFAILHLFLHQQQQQQQQQKTTPADAHDETSSRPLTTPEQQQGHKSNQNASSHQSTEIIIQMSSQNTIDWNPQVTPSFQSRLPRLLNKTNIINFMQQQYRESIYTNHHDIIRSMVQNMMANPDAPLSTPPPTSTSSSASVQLVPFAVSVLNIITQCILQWISSRQQSLYSALTIDSLHTTHPSPSPSPPPPQVSMYSPYKLKQLNKERLPPMTRTQLTRNILSHISSLLLPSSYRTSLLAPPFPSSSPPPTVNPDTETSPIGLVLALHQHYYQTLHHLYRITPLYNSIPFSLAQHKAAHANAHTLTSTRELQSSYTLHIDGFKPIPVSLGLRSAVFTPPKPPSLSIQVEMEADATRFQQAASQQQHQHQQGLQLCQPLGDTIYTLLTSFLSRLETRIETDLAFHIGDRDRESNKE